MFLLWLKPATWDFPGGVKNLPFNAEDMDLIPDWGTKIPHAQWGATKPRYRSEDPTQSKIKRTVKTSSDFHRPPDTLDHFLSLSPSWLLPTFPATLYTDHYLKNLCSFHVKPRVFPMCSRPSQWRDCSTWNRFSPPPPNPPHLTHTTHPSLTANADIYRIVEASSSKP